MNGFYSIWSKPYLKSKNTDEYWMHDFELLTLILSLSMWKKLNGKVSMIADKAALKYLENSGVLRLFNGDVAELKVDEDINESIFWAAGKLFALKQLKSPDAMVDLDLVVWENMDNYMKDDILVIHREEVTDHVYPDFEKFKMTDSYIFDNSWSKEVRPCNTALLCFKDIDFIHDYVDKSIYFMKNCLEDSDNLCPMVFAEQRLISILADKANKNIGTLFPLASDIGLQSKVTHIWGHKNILKFNYDERRKFCNKIINRLRDEFQDSYSVVENIDFLKRYFN